ncbi:hypothetical protein DFA_00921 [Cavenderia fasciculata]|uniref:Transmembrane protein n=1 Tax=Cavenderia fasciculata TaxID=261658 RepID=F4PUH6_CACFS|nr:uncharacterized protein DFA_00921 [Cavenderia fasciculata]EGG21048.1 hypothetical protein DFA_00921 [Cavenderia fasciculata]|eukprot:XP_004358898.1 hypothetical protein DFA_00921 [Cavenderia fasciculata]
MPKFNMALLMTGVHFILSLLLFISSIIIFTNAIHFNGILVMLMSIWMIAAALHGYKYYDQYYFFYTYSGRGILYGLIGLLVWGSNENSYFTTIVSLLFFLFAIASVGLGAFSQQSPPTPIFGEFIPHGDKAQPLSQQDADDSNNSSNPAFTL